MAKKNAKQTSDKVASTASKILKDKRFSDASKSVAGSALSQKGKGAVVVKARAVKNLDFLQAAAGLHPVASTAAI